MVSCIYKPPIGKTDKLIELLNRIYMGVSREIWLLGDFNVDNLDRGSESRQKYLNFFKKTGLKQLINKRTRPNRRGGTCLDWISTNCDFVNVAGVIDILISDHLPVYCIGKKDREKHGSVYRNARDYSNYDADVYSRLISAIDWEIYDNLSDVEEMWTFLYEKIYEILSVMCPIKRFKQKAKITPWLSADIYRAMRKRDNFISLFKATGNQYYLIMARRHRNKVNQMVSSAKSIFIKLNYVKIQIILRSFGEL